MRKIRTVTCQWHKESCKNNKCPQKQTECTNKHRYQIIPIRLIKSRSNQWAKPHWLNRNITNIKTNKQTNQQTQTETRHCKFTTCTTWVTIEQIKCEALQWVNEWINDDDELIVLTDSLTHQLISLTHNQSSWQQIQQTHWHITHTQTHTLTYAHTKTKQTQSSLISFKTKP